MGFCGVSWKCDSTAEGGQELVVWGLAQLCWGQDEALTPTHSWLHSLWFGPSSAVHMQHPTTASGQHEVNAGL